MTGPHAAAPAPPAPTTTAAPAPTLLKKLAIAAADIKLAHSVFALPFALLAAFLCAPRTQPVFIAPPTPEQLRLALASAPIRWPELWGSLALVVVCMVAARTFAMLFNRLADRRLDATNPRTARRAFASGALAPRDGVAMLAASAAAFFAACSGFGFAFGNWWPLLLSPLVLAWLAFYSLTKRFTRLCHAVLGIALALSPLAAAVAVDSLHAPISGPHALTLWSLAAMVACWVAGFDVIYALADIEHDRREGLRSIPSALGWRGAALVSAALHVVAAAALLLAWRSSVELRTAFALGVALTLALLVVEHAVLHRRKERGLSLAFFTCNGLISLALGLLGIVDIVRP